MVMDEIRIPSKRGVIRIDSDRADALKHRWHVCTDKRDGYIRVLNRERKSLARFLMNAPSGTCVDHINGDTLDNRSSNLRLCTYKQNGQNKKGHGKHPYKGIVTFPNSARWYAQIVVNGKRKNLGGYASIEEAARAYDAAAKEAFGEYARLNFPEENKND